MRDLPSDMHPAGQTYAPGPDAPSPVGSSPRSPAIETAEHQAHILNHWLDTNELRQAFTQAGDALRKLHRLAGHYGLPSEDRASVQIAMETVQNVERRVAR